MRGKASTISPPLVAFRITPAYAGKSRKPVHCRKPVQDHPRLCGEKFWSTLTFGVALGSPPPMRGKD